eukprot:TRINITY_DN2610_c1_g2_i2.p1 TRINITY_DN2610_c1_g2~~TRINITY_DN2610_c1_g2_i2.p1  ORF type:complete len:175 (-),score=0.03 TRINITY_DN2610_c1_g2_i2:38-484(-)
MQVYSYYAIILWILSQISSYGSGVGIKDRSKSRSYICYEPEHGLQQPVLTIIGTNGGEIDQKVLTFIQNNRVSYAIENGHRYCELTYLADLKRHWSWQRFPLTLAVLPCSDYDGLLDGAPVNRNEVMQYSFVCCRDLQEISFQMLQVY